MMRALFVAGKASEAKWSELLVLPLVEGMRVDWAGRDFVWLAFLTVKSESDVRQYGQAWVRQLDEAFSGVEEPLTSEVFLEWWQGVVEADEKIEVVAVQIERNGQVVLAVFGDGEVLVSRGGEQGKVVDQADKGWQLVGGNWQAQDRWLISTLALREAVGAEGLREALVWENVEDGQGQLVMKLQTEEIAGAAGALVDFGAMETEAQPTPKIEPSPDVYLKEKPLKRRRLMAFGILLLVLIMMAGWWGGKQKISRDEEQKFEGLVAQLEQLYTQVQTNEGEGRRVTLASASALVAVGQTEYGGEASKAEVLGQWAERLEALKVQISGEHQLKQVEVWYDLSLVKPGFFGSVMAQTDETMVILDGTAGMIIDLGFDKKQASLTGSGQLLMGGTLIATAGKRVLAYTPVGVYEVDTENKTTGELIKKDEIWQRVTGLGLFAGNVYLVDAGANDIYVYPGLEAGVGERRRWLKGGQEPDLTGVVDLAIDGDLWTLDQNGKIRRMRQGEQIDYKVTGLVEDWGKTVALAVLPESEKVYVLDQGKSRVVVLDKTGAYQKQYVWSGLAGATDLAVDEAGGGIMVLSGKEIYRLEMQ